MSRPRPACALLALSLGGCFEDDPGTCDISQPAAPWEDGDGDGYVGTDDCDDTSFATNPSAAERCDGLDNNCDGSTDGPESVDATTWYLDADGDGFGDDANAETSCEELASHALRGGDCDDADATFYPGAPEDDCTDPNDYNCDGSAGGEDADEDGYYACDDCDDADPGIYPGADDVWYDGVDSNCDLLDDFDADQDGYDIDSFGGDDCDDTDPAVNPGAEDVPEDGRDQNCDGSDAALCDADEDGYDDAAGCGGLDCDDDDATINPGATEICDGVDDDCDGTIDEDDSSLSDATAWYADDDGDGYGDPGRATLACSAPFGTVSNGDDCDDTDAAVNPGAEEICDAADTDEDCDGLVDDADSSTVDLSTWYRDADGDAFGDASTTVDACERPSGYSSDSTDCDDADASVNPGATEVTGDEEDSNCDGRETCYTDADLDGYADDSGATRTSTDADCGDSGEASAYDPLTDCDDADASVHPSASDATGDEVDSNCDGRETCYTDADLDGYADDSGATKTSTDADCTDSGEASASDPLTDCDDADASVNPGEAEICDSLDDDCDGLVDEDDPDLSGAGTYYEDRDGDAYGDPLNADAFCSIPAGYTTDASDCDDTDASVNPAATETANDGVDSDCDGYDPATNSTWTLDDCSADGGISLVVKANGAFGACVVSGTDFYGDDPSCSWRPPLLVASDGTQYEIRTASTTNDVQLSDTEATSKIVLSALPDLDIQIDQVLTGTTLTQTYTFTNNGTTDLDYDVYRTSDPDLDFGFQAAHPYTSSSPEPQPALGSCPSGDVEYGGRCCPDFNPTCTSSLYNTRKGYAGFNVPWEIDGDPAACSYDRVSDATAGYCVAEGDGGGDATYDGYRMVMGQSNGSAIHAHLGYALGFYVQERQETTTVRYVLKDDGSDETLSDLPQDVPSGDPLPGIDWDYAFGVGGAGDLGILLSWQLHVPAGGSATLVTTTIWTPAVECP